MSKIFFCRKLNLIASHFYWIKGLSEEENHHLFGEAIHEHDHNWQITVWLEGPLDPKTGMVANLEEIDKVLNEKIVNVFDRTNFNRAHPFFKDHQPTTEQIAHFLSEYLVFESGTCQKIRVSEDGDMVFAEWHR